MLKPLIIATILVSNACAYAGVNTFLKPPELYGYNKSSLKTVNLAKDTIRPIIYNLYLREIQISISQGLYEVHTIDSSRYLNESGGPSIGISYQKALAGKLKWQISSYYTQRRFKLIQLDSIIQTSEVVVITKNFSMLDIIGALTYNFQECPRVKAYITCGIGAGIIVKGNHYVKGLTEPQFSKNPRRLFSSTGILLFGGGMKSYFTKRLGIDLKFLWHRNLHNVIRGEEKFYDQMHLEAGLCYAF